jgi:uncharacterized membrane protein YqhA
MQDLDPRPPLLPAPLLRAAKVVFGVLAAAIAVLGGMLTFGIAALELWAAMAAMVGPTDPAVATQPIDLAIVFVVKSIDAALLGLVQFLLAAFLWQIFDPAESLLDDENMERLEEAKQILCKVVIVIVAVRMLSELMRPSQLAWTHLVFPAGILALAFATSSLGRTSKPAE